MAWIRKFLKKLSWFVIKTERSVASVNNFMHKAKLKRCVSSVNDDRKWLQIIKILKNKIFPSNGKIKKKQRDKFQVFTVEIYPFNLNIPS